MDSKIVKLIARNNQDKMDFRNIAERVDNIRLVKLPIPALERIHGDSQKDMANLTEKAKKIEEELHARLLEGDASSIEDAHKEISQCKREAEEISDYKDLIYDALQEAKLKQRLVGFLGSEKRARILEIIDYL